MRHQNFGLLHFSFLFGRVFCLCTKKTIFAPFHTQSIHIMPKMKTHSSAKKRFGVTGTGKVKRNRATARHLMRKKSKKQKRGLQGSILVRETESHRIERLLGFGA
jgi:large subunit ribosomal protein L35